MELHFGDEQFEVDAAQLPIAFTQVTLWRERDMGVTNSVEFEQETALNLFFFF